MALEVGLLLFLTNLLDDYLLDKAEGRILKSIILNKPLNLLFDVRHIIDIAEPDAFRVPLFAYIDLH
jgi:hypothetical protein